MTITFSSIWTAYSAFSSSSALCNCLFWKTPKQKVIYFFQSSSNVCQGSSHTGRTMLFKNIQFLGNNFFNCFYFMVLKRQWNTGLHYILSAWRTSTQKKGNVHITEEPTGKKNKIKKTLTVCFPEKEFRGIKDFSITENLHTTSKNLLNFLPKLHWYWINLRFKNSPKYKSS